MAELEPDACSSSSSVHAMPFDLPFSSFTVDALSTSILPIVFVPLQVAAAAARLVLRRCHGHHNDDGDDAIDSSDGECITVTLTGRGCRGLLSLSRSDASTPAAGQAGGEQRISLRNRVGMPLPFAVAQSGSCSVVPSSGVIPAYGIVTLVAGSDGGGARGCGASVCVVHEMLERSFKSTLLV